MTSVLVVDDEPVLLEMIVSLVEDLGYTCLAAQNGRDALDLLQRVGLQPALIISDVMMPRMSGIDMVRALRADTRLVRVPVILMSAAGKPANLDGADYFLPKPFNIDELADVIARLMAS